MGSSPPETSGAPSSLAPQPQAQPATTAQPTTLGAVASPLAPQNQTPSPFQQEQQSYYNKIFGVPGQQLNQWSR